jgi:hypothetical protein
MIVWPVDLPTQTDKVAHAAMRVSAKDAESASFALNVVNRKSKDAEALTEHRAGLCATVHKAVEEGCVDQDYSTSPCSVRSRWLTKVAHPKPLQGAHVQLPQRHNLWARYCNLCICF